MRSYVTVLVAAALAAPSVACGGCSGSKPGLGDAGAAASSSAATASVASSGSNDPRARAGLLGPAPNALIQAARQGKLEDAQRAKLDDIEKTLRPDESLARDELKRYHADLVAGVKAGKLDTAKLDAHWAVLDGAAKGHQAKEVTALDAIWTTLDPSQRSAAVAKIRAAQAERDAIRAPRPQGGNNKMMLQRLSRDLDLDEEQQKKVAAIASKEPPRLVDPREQARKHTDAVLAAFEKDAFDAKSLPPLDVKMSSGAIGEQAEVVGQLLPILKPAQRDKLAANMERGGGPRAGGPGGPRGLGGPMGPMGPAGPMGPMGPSEHHDGE